MKVTVLKTHVDASQTLRRRGETIEISDREAEIKIRRGLVDDGGRGRSAPERGAAKGAPETKKSGKRASAEQTFGDDKK